MLLDHGLSVIGQSHCRNRARKSDAITAAKSHLSFLPSPQVTARHPLPLRLCGRKPGEQQQGHCSSELGLASLQECRAGSNPGSSPPGEDLLLTVLLLLPQLQDQLTRGFALHSGRMKCRAWSAPSGTASYRLCWVPEQMLIHKQWRVCPAWTAMKGTLATQQLHTERTKI